VLTEKQIEDRRLGIGGSDAGIVAGFNKDRSPLDLYLQKLGIQEFEFPESVLEIMEWGNLLEPLILKKYGEKNNYDLVKPEDSIVHPKYSWMRSNLDFVCTNKPFIGEIKTSSFFGPHWGKEGTEDIPPMYLAQCAHNRMVAEAVYEREFLEVHIPVLNSNRLKTFVYKKNDEFEKNLFQIERKFWENHVEKRIPPAPQSVNDVKTLWPNSTGLVKVADEDILGMANRIKTIQSEVKALEKEEEDLKKWVCEFLKDASTLIDSYGQDLISWNSQTSKRFDQSRCKEEDPDYFNKYLKETTTRVFRVKGKN
jgi:putative phage-type endonuclease